MICNIKISDQRSPRKNGGPSKRCCGLPPFLDRVSPVSVLCSRVSSVTSKPQTPYKYIYKYAPVICLPHARVLSLMVTSLPPSMKVDFWNTFKKNLKQHSSASASLADSDTAPLIFQPPSFIKKRNYEFHEVLGHGAFGQVIVSRHSLLNAVCLVTNSILPLSELLGTFPLTKYTLLSTVPQQKTLP